MQCGMHIFSGTYAYDVKCISVILVTLLIALGSYEANICPHAPIGTCCYLLHLRGILVFGKNMVVAHFLLHDDADGAMNDSIAFVMLR